MKTDDTEALTRQTAKPCKLKVRYSRLTCKNCSLAPLCNIIVVLH